MEIEAAEFWEQARGFMPLILTGLFALVTALAAQAYSHRKTEQRELRRARIAKLEELHRALGQVHPWYMKYYVEVVFKAKMPTEPEPIETVRVIQLLHFPELKKVVDAVRVSSERWRELAETEFERKHSPQTAGAAPAAGNPQSGAELRSMSSDVRTAVNEALAACRDLAVREGLV